MPRVELGEDVSFGENIFRKLKGKDEQITFRIAGNPYYEGKHFIQDPTDGNWEVTLCSRIMEGKDCELCKSSLALRNKARATPDKEEKAKIENLARSKAATVIWYYPILDRDTGTAAILQTTPGVRASVLEEIKAEVNVLEYDYVLTRTEKPGKYYSLVRKESKEKLTKEEKEKLEKANQLIEERLVNPIAEEAPEDIPVDTTPATPEQAAEILGGELEDEEVDTENMPF